MFIKAKVELSDRDGISQICEVYAKVRVTKSGYVRLEADALRVTYSGRKLQRDLLDDMFGPRWVHECNEALRAEVLPIAREEDN